MTINEMAQTLGIADSTIFLSSLKNWVIQDSKIFTMR